MTKRLRWGVIGAGGIADRRSIPGLKRAAGCDVVALMDVANVDAVADRHGIAKRYSTLAPLLDDQEVDAVYVATPVFLHAEQVTAAAEAGKHVLCEKPLALSVAETRRIVEACRRHGVRLREAFMMPFNPANQAIRRLLDEGAIGSVNLIRAQLSCWYPPIPGAWRQDPELGGGGAFMDLAGHLLDLIEFFDSPIESIHSQMARQLHDYAVEDAAVSVVTTRSNTLCMIDTLFNIPDAAVPCRLELYGSRGGILAEGTIGQSGGGQARILRSDPDGYDASQRRPQDAGWQTINFTPADPYQRQFEDFAESVASREPADQDHDDDKMLRLAQLLEQAYASQPRTVAPC